MYSGGLRRTLNTPIYKKELSERDSDCNMPGMQEQVRILRANKLI